MKVKLKDLMVTSFITNLNPAESLTINGGDRPAPEEKTIVVAECFKSLVPEFCPKPIPTPGTCSSDPNCPPVGK